MSGKLKVYFMGSGGIAVPTLEVLSKDERVELVGICTQPDRPAGRKKVLTPCPVGGFAESHLQTLPISKPESVNTEAFLNHLTELQPDVIVVFAFGQLLKDAVLNFPRLGCINVHTSILPKYRGASPINAAILNGDANTGVSIMQMERGLDSGPVFACYETPILGEDTYETLENKLALLSAEKLVETLLAIEEGLTATAQDETLVTHVGKIAKADGLADWSKSALELERLSRAYFPWPTLHFFAGEGKKEKKISVAKAIVHQDLKGEPGEFLTLGKDGWIIACGTGALELVEIIPAGARRMTAVEFLRGWQP